MSLGYIEEKRVETMKISIEFNSFEVQAPTNLYDKTAVSLKIGTKCDLQMQTSATYSEKLSKDRNVLIESILRKY